jgi:oxalate decarboxylase/phosphoglucose isomerase-like protein (cupin superfamily)
VSFPLIPGTRLVEAFGGGYDPAGGVIKNLQSHRVRRVSAMRGHCRDAWQMFEVPAPHQEGHLSYCLSDLRPCGVGDEWFMTKGHDRTRLRTGEISPTLRECGHMMMKTSDEPGRCEESAPARWIHVPPYGGNRSMNTGDGPLILFSVDLANAAHH